MDFFKVESLGFRDSPIPLKRFFLEFFCETCINLFIFSRYLNKKKEKLKVKKLILLLLAGSLLFSCVNTRIIKKVQVQKKPMKGRVIDPNFMDLTVRPADDFFQFVNGIWLKNNPVPADQTRWGSFNILGENNLKQVRTIVVEASKKNNSPDGSNIQKIGNFFLSGMDSARIEELGIKPIQQRLDQIESIKDQADLQNIIAKFHKSGMNVVFDFFGEQDKKNSTMVIPWLYQGGLGLPSKGYYTKEDQRSENIRNEYLDHISKMFVLLGCAAEKSDENAIVVLNIEKKLADISMTRVELRNPKDTYNIMTLSDLDQHSPNFDWQKYFIEIGLSEPEKINVAQPIFFQGISDLLLNFSIDEWKIYLKWHLLNNTASYLNSDFVNQNFAFYGVILSGMEKMQPRWKRCLGATESSLGEALGQLYVEKYFPPQAKSRALEMVDNIKNSFGQRITDLDWMSAETKEKAMEKLESFNVKIGYPDEWEDYSTLEINSDSYLENIFRADKFHFEKDLKEINKPVNRKKWGMTPQTVNAYYNPSLNEIVFPAAILQPPFFDFLADDAVNYGAIGAVIGHEMTHGFDDMGRQFDKNGNMIDWWTKEDEKKFNQRTELLVEQGNNFVSIDTFHVNGKLTLGENIADLGGTVIAFQALENVLKQKPKQPKIDGFTQEQRFFLAWANVWRSNIRPKAQIMRLKTDPHSPADFRGNVPLKNHDGFYKAFNVKTGDKMYIPVEKRARIW